MSALSVFLLLTVVRALIGRLQRNAEIRGVSLNGLGRAPQLQAHNPLGVFWAASVLRCALSVRVHDLPWFEGVLANSAS
jgi:hypothetical protein